MDRYMAALLGRRMPDRKELKMMPGTERAIMDLQRHTIPALTKTLKELTEAVKPKTPPIDTSPFDGGLGQLDNIGEEKPEYRKFGPVLIHGVRHFVDMFAVRYDEKESRQVALEPCMESTLSALFEINGATKPYSTIHVNGLDYVVVIYPGEA